MGGVVVVAMARGVASVTPVASFATRLLAELTKAVRVKVGRDYEPTSFLVKDGERGVFAKGLKLKDRVSVVGVRSEGNEMILTAVVPSGTRRGVQYEVKLMLPLGFKCSCEWSQHRLYPCKHVYATVLKVLETAGLKLGDDTLTKYTLYYAIYDSLNRLAYRKSKSRKSSRKPKPS
jgi:hypothetical protein